MDELLVGSSKIKLFYGDITTTPADAIVNAANSKLAGGGGVDGAIHRAGGPSIMEECRKYPGCPTGSAVITSAGKLKAKYVIHAVGPYYSGKPKDVALLAGAYRKSLEHASAHQVRTIAFPAISCGVYQYPFAEAARISLMTVRDYLFEHQDITEVSFVLFSQDVYDAYAHELEALK